MSSGAPAVNPLSRDIRVSLPAEPAGVEACLKREFPQIPSRDLTQEDVVRIIGEAAILDRAKTACGERAVTWIRRVKSDLGKPDRH